MAWVITAIAITATAGAVSARTSYVAGKTQQIELERQAEEERIAAQGRELQRREELNRALAANAVGQAMSGISGEGTPASLALSSAKKAGLSEATISLSDKLKQAALRRQGRSAKQAGYLQATSTLLQTGAQVASLVSTAPKGKKAPAKGKT
tara:strand:+ start:50 stop:505 length:456 start_codon:yes stop_codon:yes gene_type:complete